MKVIKILCNPRVVSAAISLVSAGICAIFAGCTLALGKLNVEDVDLSILPHLNNNNTSLMEVNE